MKAVWNNTLIAESKETKIVENNHYFPMESIECKYFKLSNTTTRWLWKGEASYYNLEVKGKVNKDAAWYYPQTSHAARPIENHVAFWKGVTVKE